MISVDLIIENAHILTVSTHEEIANGCVIVKNEKILDVFEGMNKSYRSGTVIDAKGKLVIPDLWTVTPILCMPVPAPMNCNIDCRA